MASKLVLQLLETDGSLYRCSRYALEKEEHPNDTYFSDGFCGNSGGRNGSRFGFSGFNLFVPGMVQHLSLQKSGARAAARMHEPVHGRMSRGRA